jgi:hypothetical protein
MALQDVGALVWVDGVVPGAGRTFWVAVRDEKRCFVGTENAGNLGGTRRGDIFLRRLDWSGRQVGSDIRLSGSKLLPYLDGVVPVSTTPRGDLVALCQQEGYLGLCLVTPTGLAGAYGPVTGVRSMVFVGPEGVVHAFLPAGGYAQLDGATGQFRIRREFHYSALFHDSTPGFLRWGPYNLGRIGFCSAGRDRLLITVVRGDNDRQMSVYLVSTVNLALIDSCRLRGEQDESYAYDDAGLARTKIVHADKGGFWIFAPWAPGGPFQSATGALKQALAFRLDKNLDLVKPENREERAPRPFSDADPGLEVAIQSNCELAPEQGVWGWAWHGTIRQRLRFLAFGRDGSFYSTLESDSLALSVSRTNAEEKR